MGYVGRGSNPDREPEGGIGFRKFRDIPVGGAEPRHIAATED